MSLDTALKDMKEFTSTVSICQSKFDDSREAHDVVCQDLQATSSRAFEMKRKVDDAQDQIRARWGRCRRATKEFETAEEDLNDSLARPGQLVKDPVWATHALPCGVPDRESNEARLPP